MLRRKKEMKKGYVRAVGTGESEIYVLILSLYDAHRTEQCAVRLLSRYWRDDGGC